MDQQEPADRLAPEPDAISSIPHKATTTNGIALKTKPQGENRQPGTAKTARDYTGVTVKYEVFRRPPAARLLQLRVGQHGPNPEFRSRLEIPQGRCAPRRGTGFRRSFL